MVISQTEKPTPAHDPPLLADLGAHIFSMDYLCFLPAILASLLWHLLPIPKMGAICLFLWSLPLYTAGAATALNKGPESLFNLILSRCPVQGVFILAHALAVLAVFFVILLFANSLGWIGSAWGEILTALLMGVGIVVPMVRIWPDYLLRVIHPKNGQGNSWLSADFPRGLGPTFLTAWKYSTRAKLPASAVVSALVSLFVVIGGVLFLHADLFPGHSSFRFIGGVFVLGLFYPLAHLVMVRAGFKLLTANGIRPVEVTERDFSPSVSPLPASEVRCQTVMQKENTIQEFKFTWQRQATERGIDYIVIVYGKAEGFVFCPSNLEHPFRVGGDYNGNFPTNAEGALSHYSSGLNQAYTDRIAWFIPFVEKVAHGEDFSLDDLELDSRKVRIITGRWPW